MPLVAGHEGAGVVVRVGSKVQHITVGDHVLLSYSSCGQCPPCFQGIPAYCSSMFDMNFKGARNDGTTSLTTLNGKDVSSHFFGQSSFASIAIARASSAIKISSDLPLDALCSLGCSVQTGAGTVLNVLEPRLGTSLVVFGTGAVGMAAVMAANLTAASKIIAVDTQEQRLQKARSLGATHSINANKGDIVAQIRAITHGLGVDRAIDTTGKIPVIRAMIDSTAPGGIAATVGAPRFGETIDIEPASWLARGVSYVGVHQGSADPQKVCKAFIMHCLCMLTNIVPTIVYSTTYRFLEGWSPPGGTNDQDISIYGLPASPG